MDRSRSVDPESATADPAPARVPVRPAVPGGEVAARLLDYQATGGNQMVVRLLAAARQATGSASGESVAEGIRGRLGGGSPLPADVRAEAEAGFGRPLGDVRVHTDASAGALATQLNAHAFTTGNDIFFNSGQYNPGSRGGYEVLVHELTHTMQAPSGQVSGRLAAEGLSVSELHDPAEREARAVAARLTAQRGTRADTGAPLLGESSGSSAGDHGPLVVHRHSSWEHTLLGDTTPDKLGEAVDELKADKNTRTHLLHEMNFQVHARRAAPEEDPRQRFPNLHWIQLAKSELWVTYGELNALPDYLPDPSALDGMPRPQLLPVLQRMRDETARVLDKINFSGMLSYQTPGMATHPAELISPAGGQIWALDNATAQLGHDRYQGLLAKNACHFAPFSWQRWEHFHNEAAKHAAQVVRRPDSGPIKDAPVKTNEPARLALLNNGYADHFLQDSFAAGHLVNKTLVMQWWMEYLMADNRQTRAEWEKMVAQSRQRQRTDPPHPDEVWFAGQPAPDVRKRMRSDAQRGVAGRDLYNFKPSTETSVDDKERGTGVTDPQTAQERTDRQRRRAGSGVTGATEPELEENYQAYLQLLNNAQAQGASKAAHDHFNKIGLTVYSGNGTRMRVGGDDTLMTKSDREGAEIAAKASQLSRQAILDRLNTGETAISNEQIFGYVPVAVVPDGTAEQVPLEQWNETKLRKVCFEEIFPDYRDSWTKSAADMWPELVSGGMSRDTRPVKN